MHDMIFLTYFRVSAVCGAVLCLLRLLRGLVQNHTTAAGRCVLWGLLAVWLLIPWHVTIPGSLELAIPNAPIRSAADYAVPEEETQMFDREGTLPVRAETAKGTGMTPLGIVTAVWLGGAACFLLWQAGACAVLRCRVLRNTAAPEDREARAQLEAAARTVGLRRPPKLLCGPHVDTPMVLGIFRPMLLMPELLPRGDALELIFRHELTHIRRRDLLLKFLLLLANALHWFNPAVWAMARRASLDLELACDDAMLRDAEETERRTYGDAILTAAEQKTMPHALAAPFVSGPKNIKQRLENILNPRRIRRGGVPIALILACTLLLGGLLSCTAYVPPRFTDGVLDLGSLFDQLQIDKNAVRVRGLTADMTQEDVMQYYGLTEADIQRTGPDSPVAAFTLNDGARIREAKDFPVSLQFYFTDDTETLQRVAVTVSYVGADWETAFENAQSLLKALEKKLGSVEPFASWDGSGKGWYVHEYGDGIENLSEPDTNYSRQYMHMDGSQSGFAVSLSCQDMSRVDTTAALGQNVDMLFNFGLMVPIRN